MIIMRRKCFSLISLLMLHREKNVDGCILRGKYFLREKEADCVNELVLEKSYITKKVLIMRLAK